MSRGKTRAVDLDRIQAAVRAVESDLAAGLIDPDEANLRILACHRAMTERDLSRASAGRTGSARRWGRGRLTTVLGVLGVLVALALGVLLVTWLLAQTQTG